MPIAAAHSAVHSLRRDLGQIHLIWRIYVFQSLPILVVVIFAQQHMETCRCLGREQWPMDHEVSLF